MSGACVFCRVLARSLPGSFVYEDDEVAAFLDAFPLRRGHTLVVPKVHVTDLRDCPPPLAGRLFSVSAGLAAAVVRAVGAEGCNVWTAAGRSAGQTVFHCHLHVLPRAAGDGLGWRVPQGYPLEAARAELEETAAAIRAAG